MGVISNTPRPGYVWDSTDNVWYPIGVGAHQHTNAADTPAVMPYSTYAAAGKNKCLNGDMGIWQRGTSFNPSAVGFFFGADRFSSYNYATSATTLSQQAFTPGAAPISGYEGKYFLRVSSTNTATYITTAIEDARTLAGQTATFSFWAKSASAQTLSEVRIVQYFGGGGGASGPVSALNVTQAITTSWTRYTFTFTMPSISGKTLSGGNDSISINIKGAANNDLDTWGWQLEAGSTATAFQTATGNPASELAACQRYYWRSTAAGQVAVGTGATESSTTAWIVINNPTTMRVAPTSVDFATLTVSDSYSYTVDVTSVSGIQFSPVAGRVTFTVASGLTQGRVAIGQTKSTGGYIGFSAEL